MKFKLLVLTTVLASNFVSAQESPSPDAFVDLQGIRDSFDAKSDIFVRLFKLLYGSLATTEQAENQTKRNLPQIATPFRRLNIFGLQLPPVEPPRNLDDTICTTCPQVLVPDILSVTASPDDANTPSFFVVPPPGLRSQRLTATQPTHHYPELEFEELKQAAGNKIEKQDPIEGW